MDDIKQNIKGYKIIKKIGSGGNGAVYLVEKENNIYALKKITDLFHEDIENYQKLLNVLFKINNENIIKYYESFLENNCLYIIMEYGGDLDLKKFIDQRIPLLIEEKIIKDIIIQICLGLKEVHKNNIIHRDLTPDNIFMDKNYKIKIGDFEISKVLTPFQNLAITRIGKHHYFAPEIENGKEYTNKVDIYALGCIMYELFTLNEYYDINNENEKINTDIYNPKWQNLIDLTLNDNYNKRPDIEEIYNYIKYIININDNNEINCIYNKDRKEINLLNDFKDNSLGNDYKEFFNETKQDINEDNTEIYINDKKIKFTYKYDSDEIGLIKIKFKFNKLLISTAYMFFGCSSLKSIDLSLFNTKYVKNMNHMFDNCLSLESIDFSLLNNKYIKISNSVLKNSSLNSLVLSLFITNNVTDMSYMFSYCSSLKSLDFSLFNTNNVKNINHMFNNCSSLKLILSVYEF